LKSRRKEWIGDNKLVLRLIAKEVVTASEGNEIGEECEEMEENKTGNLGRRQRARGNLINGNQVWRVSVDQRANQVQINVEQK
jgi:hypothetical protein